MTDTTDQQAVTVAQEDRDAAEAVYAGLIVSLGQQGHKAKLVVSVPPDDDGLVQAFAHHRLASVSSASAETGCYQAKFRALLIEAGRNAGAFISDSASDEFLELIPEEVRLKVERLATPPEPVPATNQAGEVERYRHIKRGTVYEVIGTAELQAEQLQGDHAALTVYRGEDGKLWARNTAEFHDGRFERLATQPATSQEGEEALVAIACDLLRALGRDRDGSVTVTDVSRVTPFLALAATPTPPTQTREAEGWRDIGSAPKDGTSVHNGTAILTYRKCGLQSVAQWMPGRGGGWMMVDGVRLIDVTHWMPLPGAPRAALSAGSAGQ